METIVENRTNGIEVVYGVTYRHATHEEVYEARIRSAIPRRKIPVVHSVQVRIKR